MEQLPVVQALALAYVFLDAFYSTGKSEILKHVAKHWIKQKKVVHYFIHRPEFVGKEVPLKVNRLEFRFIKSLHNTVS